MPNRKTWDYSGKNNRGGYQGRGTIVSGPNRSPENERDLGLAIQAYRHMQRTLAAIRCRGDVVDQHAKNTLLFAKSMVWQLRRAELNKASPKQLASLLRILNRSAPPPVHDPIPAAAKVLPLKPPGRAA